LSFLTLLDELGNDRLLELVDIDGRLYVLACGEGRVRLFTAGSTEQAAREVTFARFMLRRLAFGPAVPALADVHHRLSRMGETLEQVLLGEAGSLGDGKVIVVPPGKLHAVPWGLLPQLRSRAVSVVPSASSWLRAHRAAASDGQNATAGSVVLVRGPGLASQGAEIPQLAADYSNEIEPVVVLGDGTATTAQVLSAIDGARLVHFAAHGTFRADSPLFSALRLDDGPLTVYDLERLRRGPRQLVLSSCASGVVAPVGADEVRVGQLTNSARYCCDPGECCARE
jgi:hypothetical protein